MNDLPIAPQNEVRIRGTLKRKGQLVAGENGKTRLPFTVTVPRGKTGLYDFCSCISFGGVAQNVDSIAVGSVVSIEGGIRSSSWITQDGTKQYAQNVIVWKIGSYGATGTTEPPPSHDEGGES